MASKPKEIALYTPAKIFKFVEGKTDKVNLFKSDAHSAGLMFLVCCGCLQDELVFLDKYDEESHELWGETAYREFLIFGLSHCEYLIC